MLALGACEECISNAVRARVSAPYCTFEAARSSTRRPATLCLSCSAPLTVEGAHRTAPWRYQVKRRRSEAAWGVRRGSDWCVRERRPRSPRPAAGRAARGFCDEPCSILRRREENLRLRSTSLDRRAPEATTAVIAHPPSTRKSELDLPRPPADSERPVPRPPPVRRPSDLATFTPSWPPASPVRTRPRRSAVSSHAHRLDTDAARLPTPSVDSKRT